MENLQTQVFLLNDLVPLAVPDYWGVYNVYNNNFMFNELYVVYDLKYGVYYNLRYNGGLEFISLDVSLPVAPGSLENVLNSTFYVQANPGMNPGVFFGFAISIF